MTPDSPLTPDSRRNFVKKSLAASIIAAQPTILAGLIRAEGAGGGGTTGTTDPWGTTTPETTGTETTEVKPQTRNYRLILYYKSTKANGTFEFTDDIDVAPVLSGTALLDDNKRPGINYEPPAAPPSIPKADDKALQEIGAKDYTGSDALTEGPLLEPEGKITQGRTAIVVDNVTIGYKKYFMFEVNYIWLYGTQTVSDVIAPE